MVVVVVAIEIVVTLPDAVCLVILISNVCLGWLPLKMRVRNHLAEDWNH